MRSLNEHKNLETRSYRMLRLLEEVELTPDMSQRRLSNRLGIALGITNILLKSLVIKGYIRVVHVKWRRWAYILTPAGISRKVQLTIAYTERFFGDYRRVRELLQEDLRPLKPTADAKIAIYGTTELAELAFLTIRDLDITRFDFIGEESSGKRFLGMPVLSLDSIDSSDYVMFLVAYPSNVEARCGELRSKGVPRHLIMPLLKNTQSALGEARQQEPTE